MDETPLTNEELIEAVKLLIEAGRYQQSLMKALAERVEALESHYHTPETRRIEGSVTTVTPGRIATAPPITMDPLPSYLQQAPQSPLPSRLRTT